MTKQAEQPERVAGRPVTVDDIRQLAAGSTPHFSMQIRNRITALISGLAPEDPARIAGEAKIAELESLAFTGEVRGEHAQPGQRPLDSVNADAPIRRTPNVVRH